MHARFPASLEVLRQEARDELDAVIEHRCRNGDDPWEVIPQLPTVDEHVVATLRQDALEAEGMAEEPRPRAASVDRARHRGALRVPAPARHRAGAPRPLRAVWTLIGRMERDLRRR
ncbi:hypothetical protein [Clavibacter tessellarius]|uniref:hypothetical protein n=1 Tax=Clavibacter tessellarius TaxID=31965 RepID=UPI003247C1EB